MKTKTDNTPFNRLRFSHLKKKSHMTSADLFSPRFLQLTALDPLPVVDRCIVRVRVF